MKKSILVLSALLTLVVSGVCLQSCSSEYDEYTTEEYGYYTEEEIAAMKAIAEDNGVELEFDRNYYGEKLTMNEFEEELVCLLAMEGDYEIVPIKNEKRTIQFMSRKKASIIKRNSTRVAETWGKTNYSTKYEVSVNVKWDFSKSFIDEMLITKGEVYTKSNIIRGELQDRFSGGNIEFWGTIRGTTDYGIQIAVSIENGIVYNYAKGGTGGNFKVSI
ncbi:MAG: hypothetical protein IJ290_07135 [Bacteroidaceae bacterium]|nr:hypothetical protein [Bacteroidaceae bacterium]